MTYQHRSMGPIGHRSTLGLMAGHAKREVFKERASYGCDMYRMGKRRYEPLIVCGEMLQMLLLCVATEGLEQHNKIVTSCWAIDLAAAMSFTVPFCCKNWLQTGHHVDAHAGNSM